MAEFENSEEIPKVITFLSSLLQRVAETNDVFRHLNSQKISIFHGLTRPAISVYGYLQRIFKYAYCSPSCYITAYIYLDRFAKKQPLLPINSFNVHRLLITSVLVSAKFMDDIFYNNAYYAKVGGISTAEMNLLEVDFLFGLGFQLNVTPQTFHTYCCYIQREMLQQSPPLHFPPSNLDHYYINEDGPTHQQQLSLQLIHNLV
ncbi:cyclin-U4-1-like [Olea europaea var. sylvestris]|uniref:Cyclin n=1 Tax=Olea europaea subsp. europaea TaxID=158383 RepID=A0A8S0THK7_OLEEU|nr:cyclin-U4-1-like [Olea europaea var. sylvestris]CAA3005369.1 cyclin-U4-1-like [Olea europaea subsp. europaea]